MNPTLPIMWVSHLFRKQFKKSYSIKVLSSLSAQEKLDELSRKLMKQTLVSKPKPEKIRKNHPLKFQSIKLKDDEIIQCKSQNLNHYRNQTYDKFDVIPLASKGWNHYKSKGDYFIINIHPTGYENMSRIDLGTFEDSGLLPDIVNILSKRGVTKPTEIQKLGIPILLKGKNSILVAETGCGKTLSFLTPLIQQILSLKRQPGYEGKKNSPLALIITPGRELVFQIGEVAEWFAELGITYKCLSGGDMKRKISAEPEDIDILIASIGALSKLTTVGTYSTKRVRHVILDEADTLLDDSFNDKMVYYLSRMKMHHSAAEGDESFTRQLTLVGATMPTNVAEILNDIIDVDSIEKVITNRAHQLLPYVPQKFVRIGASQKPVELLKIAKNDIKHNIPLIIFSNKTVTSDWVSMFLNENGVDCVNLNKATMIDIRKQQLLKFQQGIVNVMSCTDVASRGLDTVRAKHILNYDLPYYISDYIHRCGRTGRHTPHGLVQGTVTNFISNNPREIELTQTIEKSVRVMKKELPNVNANIRKIIHFRYLRKQENINKREDEKAQYEALKDLPKKDDFTE